MKEKGDNMSEIIFSKDFEKEREADEQEFERLSKLPHDSSKAKQFLYDLEHNMQYVEHERRIACKDYFISVVEKFINSCEFDVEIEQRPFGICANIKAAPMFSLFGDFKSCFGALIDECDDVDFVVKDDHILISVTYYTHEQYFNGRKIKSLE